jgi:hypothetical protein
MVIVSRGANRFLLCLAAAAVLQPVSTEAAADDVSYPVVHSHTPFRSNSSQRKPKDRVERLGEEGSLALVGSTVSFSEPANPEHNFTMDCSFFLQNSSVSKDESDQDRLQVSVMRGLFMPVHNLYPSGWMTSPSPKQKGGGIPPSIVPISAVYSGLRKPCEVFRAESEKKQAERRAEEEKKTLSELAERDRVEAKERQDEIARREAEVVRRAAEFREGILAALRAAEEPDPFFSIRGEFDLSAASSRQYKTSLHLPDAEKCALLKTPPPTATAASAWTFACLFPSTGGGYEGMVKSVQSVLNLPFQPDERAVTINQVFFADPSKPTSRVFVGKLNVAAVGVSVVAVRLAGGAPAVTNTTPFPNVPTMLPIVGTMLPTESTEPTVRDEVEKIRSGRYAPMPTAQRATVSAPAFSGRTTMTVKNSTAYELSVFFDGPVSQKLTLAPGSSQDLDLAPGTFHVAGRVAASNVLPFYGEETYSGSARYSVEFYIAPQAR